MPPAVTERIVVRAPNWLGDVVLSLAALRDLRRNFPQARIEMLARPAVAPLYGAVGQRSLFPGPWSRGAALDESQPLEHPQSAPT